MDPTAAGTGDLDGAAVIITSCVRCDRPIFCPYEAGEPCAGQFDRRVCEGCGAANFIQLVSIGGVTLSEDGAKKAGLIKAHHA